MSFFDGEGLVQDDTIKQSQVNDKLVCSVCHEDFCLSEPVSKLVCGHVFHTPCIAPWLLRKNTCPVCRRVLLEPVTDDDDGDGDGEEEEEYDDEIIDVGVDQEVTLIDNATSSPLMTVSVQYRSQTDQHDRLAPDITIQTITESDDDSEFVLDFIDSNSLSSSSSDSNMDDFNTSYEQPSNEDVSDVDSDVSFLELDNGYDTDVSDTNYTDIMDTFDPNDLNMYSSSNYFDVTSETSMDIDQDYF